MINKAYSIHNQESNINDAMIKLKDFEIRALKMRHNAHVIIDETTTDLSKELKELLSQDGTVVSVVDARMLYDKNALRSQLNQLPSGILIIDHITEVPVSEHQDIIISLLRSCLKGDYIDTSCTFVGEEWMNHFAEAIIGVVGIVQESDYKTLAFRSVFPLSGCALFAITDEGVKLL